MKKVLTALVFLAAAFSPGVNADAAQPTAEEILRKIINCYEVSDYSGIFAAEHGTENFLNHVFHIHPDFTQISCIFPPERAGRIVYLKKSNMYLKDAESDTLYLWGSGFHPSSLGLEKENIDLILGNYSVKVSGDTALINRNAVLVSIHPNVNDRPGYRLVVEKEHGLILVLLKLSPEADKLFGFHFTEVNFKPRLEQSLINFDPEVYPIVGREFVDFNSIDELEKAFGRPLVKFNYLPDGFALHQKRLLTRNDRKIAHLVFTDGLSNISFFVRLLNEDEEKESAGETAAIPQVQRKGPNNFIRGVKREFRINCIGEQDSVIIEKVFKGIE